ncbi:MAG: glycosyltransferase family 2 protein [Elusimicrobiota bacterium]
MKSLSVIIPVHNAGPYLKEAVGSVLAQNLPGLDIVVVDDGSTDDGVHALNGQPIRVVKQSQRGEAAARNAGVKSGAAPFVTFLDADDIIVPGALASRLEFLLSHPDENVVGGFPSKIIDERGEIVAEVFERMAAKHIFPLRLNEAFYRAGHFFPVSCSLYVYRREAFDRIGLYDETLPVAPDCDFHFRLLKSMEVPILKIPVFDRRLHESNLSMAGASPNKMTFRPMIVETVRAINRRHGYDPQEIIPWEVEYL